MADDLDDEVFIMENGIITNQNVPLILQHDLEEEVGGDVDIADELDDVVPELVPIVVENPVVHFPAGVQEVYPELPAVEMPLNGFHVPGMSASSSSSMAQSPLVEFEQSEILGASSPARGLEAACYVNECYQSDELSELSEFTPSVEIHTDTATVSFKGSSLRMGDASGVKGSSKEKTLAVSTSSSEKETQVATTSAGLSATIYAAEASTSAFDDNSERCQPNPPNSPANFGSQLSRSGSAQRLLRRYRNRRNPQVRQLSHPDRPSNLFLKFGSYFLMLVFFLLLAIIASLEGLLPQSYLTVILVLWVLSFIAAIGCFMKACWEERDLVSERPDSRSSYGSTSTRTAVTNAA